MRLVVDANVLVSELLRERGQILISSSDLETYVAAHAWSETQHEIRKRSAIIEQQGRIAPGTGEALARAAIIAIVTHVRQIPVEAYAAYESRATASRATRTTGRPSRRRWRCTSVSGRVTTTSWDVACRPGPRRHR